MANHEQLANRAATSEPQQWRRRKLWRVCLARHRSSEAIGIANARFWCTKVELVKAKQVPVTVHYGVEKHLKHDVDRLFGWYEQAIANAKDEKSSILTIEALRDVLQSYFRRMQQEDPGAPVVKVLLDVDSQVPSQSYKLVLENAEISRSYCFGAVPAPRAKFGVQLYNHVFSTRPAAVQLRIVGRDAIPTPDNWRRGYWGKGAAAWDTQVQPLGVHDETVLTRRQKAQEAYLPNHIDRLHAVASPEEILRRRVAQNQRRRERAAQQRQAHARRLKSVRDSSRSSDGSGSSTSSSSSSTDDES